jgi:hypothetical protein
MNQQDIIETMNRAFILDNTTVDEQVDFISDQIKHPFDTGDSNYFKKLRGMVKPDKLDQICMDLFSEIENVYPDLQIDYSDLDEHLADSFSAVYKLFVRNVNKLFYTFLREYLYSSKNRKAITADYVNTKLPNYPKEQYGKKEFYVLINKLPAIIKDIFSSDIRLEEFLDTIERSGSSPMYFTTVRDLLNRSILVDHGVVSNMYDRFKKSDAYDATLCKLQMKITKDLICPYLEENGLSALRLPTVEEDEDEPVTSEEDDENNE